MFFVLPIYVFFLSLLLSITICCFALSVFRFKLSVAHSFSRYLCVVNIWILSMRMFFQFVTWIYFIVNDTSKHICRAHTGGGKNNWKSIYSIVILLFTRAIISHFADLCLCVPAWMWCENSDTRARTSKNSNTTRVNNLFDQILTGRKILRW